MKLAVIKGAVVRGLKVAGKFIKAKSPIILAVGAAIGVGVVIYETIKATPGALMEVEDARFEKKNGTGKFEDAEDAGEDLTTWEVVKIAAKHYIRVMIAAIVTVAMISCSTAISARRVAALTGALGLAESHIEDLTKAAKEFLPEKKMVEFEDKVNEVAKEKNPLTSNTYVEPTSGGRELFLLEWTGQYFESSIDRVRRVVNDGNTYMANYYCGYSLNDFQDGLGITNSKGGELVGFNLFYGDTHKLEVTMTSSYAPEGSGHEHMTILGFRNPPVRDFDSEPWDGR